MAHSLPDYTTKYRMATIFGNIDDAELAVRLGSIVTHDRRGNLVMLDDFETTLLKWNTSTLGAGSSVSLTTSESKSGEQSLKFVTGSTIGYAGLIERYLPYPVIGGTGIEFSILMDDSGTRLDMELILYDGTNYKRGGIRLDSGR